MTWYGKTAFFIVHCLLHFFAYWVPRFFRRLYNWVCCCSCCTSDAERRRQNFIFRPERDLKVIHHYDRLEVVEDVFGLFNVLQSRREDKQYCVEDYYCEQLEDAKHAAAVAAACELADERRVGSSGAAMTGEPQDATADGGTVVPQRSPSPARPSVVAVPDFAQMSKEVAREKARLRKLKKEKMLSYTSPLYSGHIGTVMGAFRPSDPVAYTRERFVAWDGCPLFLDWLYADGEAPEAFLPRGSGHAGDAKSADAFPAAATAAAAVAASARPCAEEKRVRVGDGAPLESNQSCEEAEEAAMLRRRAEELCGSSAVDVAAAPDGTSYCHHNEHQPTRQPAAAGADEDITGGSRAAAPDARRAGAAGSHEPTEYDTQCTTVRVHDAAYPLPVYRHEEEEEGKDRAAAAAVFSPVDECAWVSAPEPAAAVAAPAAAVEDVDEDEGSTAEELSRRNEADLTTPPPSTRRHYVASNRHTETAPHHRRSFFHFFTSSLSSNLDGADRSPRHRRHSHKAQRKRGRGKRRPLGRLRWGAFLNSPTSDDEDDDRDGSGSDLSTTSSSADLRAAPSCPPLRARKARGVVVVFPGLASTSQSNYIQRLVRSLHRSSYHVCVINTRGMAPEMELSEDANFLFNGGYTRDARDVVRNVFSRENVLRRFYPELFDPDSPWFAGGGLEVVDGARSHRNDSAQAPCARTACAQPTATSSTPSNSSLSSSSVGPSSSSRAAASPPPLRHCFRTRPAVAVGLPVIGIGMSIGGAVLSKYLGEEGLAGRDCCLDAAVTVCPPNDFPHLVEHMNRSTYQKSVYQPDTCQDVRNYVLRHPQLQRMPNVDNDYVFGRAEDAYTVLRGLAKHAAEPHGRGESAAQTPLSAREQRKRDLEPLVIDNFTRIIHFDEHLIAKSAGYRSIHHYHYDTSAFKWAPYTPIPLLVFSTHDDPVIGRTLMGHQWREAINGDSYLVDHVRERRGQHPLHGGSCVADKEASASSNFFDPAPDAVASPLPPAGSERVLSNNKNIVYCESHCGGHMGFLGGPIDELMERDDFLQRFVVQRLASVSDFYFSHVLHPDRDRSSKGKGARRQARQPFSFSPSSLAAVAPPPPHDVEGLMRPPFSVLELPQLLRREREAVYADTNAHAPNCVSVVAAELTSATSLQTVATTMAHTHAEGVPADAAPHELECTVAPVQSTAAARPACVPASPAATASGGDARGAPARGSAASSGSAGPFDLPPSSVGSAEKGVSNSSESAGSAPHSAWPGSGATIVTLPPLTERCAPAVVATAPVPPPRDRRSNRCYFTHQCYGLVGARNDREKFYRNFFTESDEDDALIAVDDCPRANEPIDKSAQVATETAVPVALSASSPLPPPPPRDHANAASVARRNEYTHNARVPMTMPVLDLLTFQQASSAQQQQQQSSAGAAGGGGAGEDAHRSFRFKGYLLNWMDCTGPYQPVRVNCDFVDDPRLRMREDL